MLVFNPRRVPTINCTISDSGDLSWNNTCDDGTTDLGIRCVRQEVLDQISVESSCGAESSTTALGVLVGLLVALLVVLLIVCGVMWNHISQKHKQM